MDDGDRAVSVMHQAGADGAEQRPAERTHAARADDDHVGVLRQVDQRRNRSAVHHHAVHHRRRRIAGGLRNGVSSLLENPYGLILLPLEEVRGECEFRRHRGGRHHRHHNVDKREGDVAHRGVARGPRDCGLRRGGTVDADQDAAMCH
jgi:hypothetical protein